MTEPAAVNSFRQDGYLVVRGAADHALCADMVELAASYLAAGMAPIEYEADVGYPGSPASMEAAGGETARRLLNAYSRDAAWREWATGPLVSRNVQCLMGEPARMSQSHHNCIMTKHPGYSSETLWHQDSRYWSFDRPDLVTAWLALGHESPDNGCLRVIPGTHAMSFDRGRFDRALFLRPDLGENEALIAKAIWMELNPGDLLLFHSRLFHAAGRNLTGDIKYSLVFTYHGQSNRPIAGTRSARFPSVALPAS